MGVMVEGVVFGDFFVLFFLIFGLYPYSFLLFRYKVLSSNGG